MIHRPRGPTAARGAQGLSETLGAGREGTTLEAELGRLRAAGTRRRRDGKATFVPSREQRLGEGLVVVDPIVDRPAVSIEREVADQVVHIAVARRQRLGPL